MVEWYVVTGKNAIALSVDPCDPVRITLVAA